MAYTPKQWVCGEKITADGLNNIEEGVQEALVGGGASIPKVNITITYGATTTATIDKTYDELIALCGDNVSVVCLVSRTITNGGNLTSEFLGVISHDAVIINDPMFDYATNKFTGFKQTTVHVNQDDSVTFSERTLAI